MRQKIIIGIHGLGNKPTRRILRRWWRWSICEGLARIAPQMVTFNFELVYWAHYYNSRPLSIRVKDENHPLYITAPYVPAKPENTNQPVSKLRKLGLDLAEKVLDILFLRNRLVSLDIVGDWIIRKKFADLDFYYNESNLHENEIGLLAKTQVRNELASALQRHREKDILLIAHSMGSIIAYDVLTQIVPDIKIHTFMTMGSPLGLPAIMKKIFKEQGKDFRKEKRVATPENIRHAWLNFSDLHDNIAFDYNLSDDYRPNSHGVGPLDFIIHNNYEYRGNKNPHKSYGYLRTPEMARAIHAFLSEKPALRQRALQWLMGLFSKK